MITAVRLIRGKRHHEFHPTLAVERLLLLLQLLLLLSLLSLAPKRSILVLDLKSSNTHGQNMSKGTDGAAAQAARNSGVEPASGSKSVSKRTRVSMGDQEVGQPDLRSSCQSPNTAKKAKVDAAQVTNIYELRSSPNDSTTVWMAEEDHECVPQHSSNSSPTQPAEGSPTLSGSDTEYVPTSLRASARSRSSRQLELRLEQRPLNPHNGKRSWTEEEVSPSPIYTIATEPRKRFSGEAGMAIRLWVAKHFVALSPSLPKLGIQIERWAVSNGSECLQWYRT